MAAPTSPYATHTEVALFQKNLLRGATDFSSVSVLPDTTIDQYLIWTSAAIDIRLSEAGYVVPLQELTGETWPVHQTNYLSLLATIGAVAMINPGLKPAPAMSPGQRGTGNIFKDFYDKELQLIGTTRFRASFYLGSKVETLLTEPYAAQSDWLRTDIDKTKYMNLTQFTELQNNVNVSIQSQQYKWDYMYDLFNLGYGKI